MAIELTDAAVCQVRKMMESNQLDGSYGLRIGIKAGGCAGHEYRLEIEEGPGDRDRVFECEGVKVFCDPRSYLFINGTVLDFKDSLLGGGFQFNNPNAKSSCGCGTSFSTS